MNLKKLNIAAAKALGLKNIVTACLCPVQYTDDGDVVCRFDLADPACMNMMIEHFKIDVISYSYRKYGLVWLAVTTDGEHYGEDPNRDTAIMKCVTKCLEVESE